MRQFRIECIALAKEAEELAWDNISGAAQSILKHFAPGVLFRNVPGGWEYTSDEWHHWNALFDAEQWVTCGTLVFAALVTLMLRTDPELADFAAALYYRDHNGAWIECG